MADDCGARSGFVVSEWSCRGIRRSWWLWMLMPGLLVGADWPPGACTICLRFLDEGEVSFRATDRVEQTEREVCSRCAARPELCFLCALPTRADRLSLSDGRHYCARDASRALFDGERIRRLGSEVVEKMQRSLARFMTFPGARIDWKVEDYAQRTEALEEEPVRCRHPVMRFSTRADGDGSIRYEVTLLNGLPEAWLLSAAAHGVAHAWLLEEVSGERRLASGTVEAFCEWIAWHALKAMGEPAEAERVLAGELARSQLAVFLEADRVYDMFRILEWMRFGTEDRLVAGDTDRVRRLDERLRSERGEPRQVIPPAPAVARGPDRLVLRTILGSGNRRLALINNATLAVGEEGRALVGTNFVLLRCVAMGEDWVEVKVDHADQLVILRWDRATGGE